jgi:hypothetical protein
VVRLIAGPCEAVIIGQADVFDVITVGLGHVGAVGVRAAPSTSAFTPNGARLGQHLGQRRVWRQAPATDAMTIEVFDILEHAIAHRAPAGIVNGHHPPCHE